MITISIPIGSMYAIYVNIYHQYTPFMLAYIPAPWILRMSLDGFPEAAAPERSLPSALRRSGFSKHLAWITKKIYIYSMIIYFVFYVYDVHIYYSIYIIISLHNF